MRLTAEAQELTRGFERIRRAMGLPDRFPPDAEREAETVARCDADHDAHEDASTIEFVTIDPPGSKDLDQAFHAAQTDTGYLVHYAIADVAAFVEPGSALDVESHRRGQTLYCPDERILLYPAVLSEGAASLLPGQLRPSILWSIDLDRDGEVTKVDVRRASVKSRRQLTYEEAQREIDGTSPSPSLALLKTIGLLRLEQERQRGGVSLNMPDQEVLRQGSSYRLSYRAPLPVESWNAQISLLTGMSAARVMIEGGFGLLRTMPAPDDDTIALLKRRAAALQHEWPSGATYADFVRTLDPKQPSDAALVMIAARLFRGVRYAAFEGAPPEDVMQHAVAAPYAHVTAPLRRMGDRYANELVVSIAAKKAPPSWCLDALPVVPDEMKDADRREGELERRIVDFVEAVVMQNRVGETFSASVVEVGRHGGTIQLTDPAVLAQCDGSLVLGSTIRARLVEADPERGRLRFQVVDATVRDGRGSS